MTKKAIQKSEIKEYVVNDYVKAYFQFIDNCWTYSVFSQDPNDDIFTKEFNAGFVQAKIQGND